MTTSATIRQTRTVLASGKFQLISIITASDGFRAGTIPVLTSTRSLFVLDENGAYQHLARVGDVEEYADGPNVDPYYRVASVTLEFDTVEEAQAESDAQKQGLSDLVTDYDVYKTTYEAIDEDTSYSAP